MRETGRVGFYTEASRLLTSTIPCGRIIHSRWFYWIASPPTVLTSYKVGLVEERVKPLPCLIVVDRVLYFLVQYFSTFYYSFFTVKKKPRIMDLGY